MNTFVKLFVVAVLAFVFLPFGVFAAPVVEAPYKVQPGDTLWDLSAAYHNDPLKWAEVLGANPFLKEKGRVINHPDGRVIVLIRPGEELAGLNRIGVKAEMIPFASLWSAAVSATPASVPVATTSAESGVIDMTVGKAKEAPFYQTPVLGIPLWAVVFSAIIVVLSVVTLVLAIVCTMRKDGILPTRSAATAGPPIVLGGISVSQPVAIEDRFARIAERRYGERNPSADLSVAAPQRVGEIESGFLSGRGRVQYRDHSETRRMHREPAYRARFRFPDGTEEDLFFLQPCANDVRFSGTRYSGFQWEPERVVIASPMPMSAPVPVESVASGLPTRTPLRAVASPTPPVMTTVAVGDIRVSIPEGSSVQIGRDGRIIIAVATACDVVVAPAQEAGAATKTVAS